MHTILGANGVIARNLSKALVDYTTDIRQVSRNPKKVNASDTLVKADLLDDHQTEEAVKGSEVVYLLAGLPYRTSVWKTQWPVLMDNVIDACEKHNAKLVFFSNVYPYGIVDGTMTEETPFNPSSKKGEVRARIEQTLLAEVHSGSLKAMIVRAADFYGPETPLSFLDAMVFKNYAAGKKGQWMISDKYRHSFTFTPDAGKATAILGNDEKAYNQIWHAPTASPALTGKDFLKLTTDAFGTSQGYTVLAKWMIRMAGLFQKDIGEVVEMLYQYERDYVFDSSKFEKAYNFKPTTYAEGIAETVKSMH